jgi:hypothetical protein
MWHVMTFLWMLVEESHQLLSCTGLLSTPWKPPTNFVSVWNILFSISWHNGIWSDRSSCTQRLLPKRQWLILLGFKFLTTVRKGWSSLCDIAQHFEIHCPLVHTYYWHCHSSCQYVSLAAWPQVWPYICTENMHVLVHLHNPITQAQKPIRLSVLFQTCLKFPRFVSFPKGM